MISSRVLRQLVESVLLEGFKDDQRYLIEKYPAHAADLRSLSPKWIMWLIARFGESPTREEEHPLDDAIATIKNYSKKDAALGTKYADPGTEERPNVFRSSVDEAFPPKDRSWKNPGDISTMTVDEMELILGLSERKKPRFKVDDADDIEGDRIGKVGPWNLWLPTTREKSCKIAGYDPVTLQPKTTWCTARMSGSNLFYSYIGKPGRETLLFYIIKDDPESDTDWLSLGFVNGRPELPSPDGGHSVDRANKGLNAGRLRQILGPYHDAIMSALSEKNVELGGKHPAREKIFAAAQSASALDYLIRGLSVEESNDLKFKLIDSHEIAQIAQEVWEKLSGDKSAAVRAHVSRSPKTPQNILLKLSEDPDRNVRFASISNQNFPSNELMRFADDHERHIREFVAGHRATTPETLVKLASDPEPGVRLRVATNRSTPTAEMEKLAADPDVQIRRIVASNPMTASSTLAKLAQDSDAGVRVKVVLNRSTPTSVLRAMVQSADSASTLAKNDMEVIRKNVIHQLKLRGDTSIKTEQTLRLLFGRLI
jgi:hypothetical protein